MQPTRVCIVADHTLVRRCVSHLVAHQIVTKSVTPILVILLVTSFVFGVRADSSDSTSNTHLTPPLAATPPSRPVNLSRSGAASSPVIVTRPDGALSVFWWDQFDGLVTADGVVVTQSVVSGTQTISVTTETWSDAATVPILIAQPTSTPAGGAGQIEPELVPIKVMPRIVTDATGRAHAFWLQQIDDTTTDLALMHGTLDAGSTVWANVGVLAETVVAYDMAIDDTGALHLSYLRTWHATDAPSGAYYTRSEDGGVTWSRPNMIHSSAYYRLLSPEIAHLQLAIDDATGVYVTWDDPRLEHIWLAGSSDRGSTWREPTTIRDPAAPVRHGRLFAAPDQAGDQMWLLWEEAGYGGGCVLYQASVRAILAGTESAGQRVWDNLTSCSAPKSELFLPLGEARVLFVTGIGGAALTIRGWDGSAATATSGGQWSEPLQKSFYFDDPETGKAVYLQELTAMLLESTSHTGLSAAGQWANQALIIVGTDGQGDVWVMPGWMDAPEMVFAPPSPWSEPVNVSQNATFPGLPAVAADAKGWVHVLWAEAESPDKPGQALYYAYWNSATEYPAGSEKWIRPVMVLRSPQGSTKEPSLVVLDDRLHVVWSGGPNGQIWYSRAFLEDAYAAGGWDDPRPLPAPAAGEGVGSRPHIVTSAGTEGILHTVYAVPVNEGRGIYYTFSKDGGGNWSPAHQVFDAAGAGWAAVDYPRLAVDLQGGLHAVWIRAALSTGEPPQGIYYAYSSDQGETWSEPMEIAEGAYAWPYIVADGAGRVHLLWSSEIAGDLNWWHRWLVGDLNESGLVGANRRAAGGEVELVPTFRGVHGPIGAVADGKGTLYLVGLGYNMTGESVLLYTTWDGSSETAASIASDLWGEQHSFHLELQPGHPGLTLVWQPERGRLDVFFRGEMWTQDASLQADLWHTGRAIPAVALVTGAPGIDNQETPTLTVLTPPALATLSSQQTQLLGTPAPTKDLNTIPPLDGEGGSNLPLTLALGGGLAALIVAGIFGLYLAWAKRR